MFIIERALNVFTLIYELEAKIRLNESSISRIGLDSQSSALSSVLVASTKKGPSFNTSFIPNQLILNASLLNELSQESSSSDKNAPQISEEKSRKSEAVKQKLRQRKESKNVVEPPSEYHQANAPKMNPETICSQGKGQPQNIPNLELSKISSPNTPNITAEQQKYSSSMSSLSNYSQSQYNSTSQRGQTGSKYKNIPTSSPRFVRVNNNIVINLSSSHRMRDSAGGGAFSAASPASPVYNNTSVQGAAWRTVWPNSNIMSNGGIGDALASPVSAKSVNRFGASSPQQMCSPKSYNQVNSSARYTVMPNPSVARYIEHKSVEGLGSPIGFSPLASPTYRKNVSRGRADNITASPPKSNLDNLTFSYKG